MEARSTRGRGFQMLSHVTPWLVLGLGLLGTLWAWGAITQQERAYQGIRLDGALAQTREAVDHRIEEQAKLLMVAKGLVVGRPRLAAEDWRAFVSSLEMRRFFPGTLTLGYLSREVLEGRKGATLFMEPEASAAGLSPLSAAPLGEGHFSQTLALARDTGRLAVTDRLPHPAGAVVALILPVYRDFSTPADAPSRRASLQGLVVCFVHSPELFRPLYGASPIGGLDVELYDDPTCRPEGLLFDRDLCAEGSGLAMAYRPGARRVPIQVGGQSWGLAVGFVSQVSAAREGRPRLVAIVGGALSMLAFGLTLFLAYSRGRLEVLTHRLTESEGRFRAVAETAACAIFIYSDKIEYMNGAGMRLSGYPLGEIVGAPLVNLVHPLDRDLVRTRSEIRRRGGSVPLRYEFRLLTKTGETRWIDFASGTVVLGGRVLGLGTAFDVTERVQANEARLKVERKLLEAQKLESLGLLAGGVAHDFNNLLAVIQGNAGIIRDAQDDPEMLRTSLKNIEDTCQRASDLVHQMLAYSGRGRVQVQSQDLNRVIQEIAQLLRVSIPKSVNLVFELAPILPAVAIDAAQIHQVVMNLVTNAAEAIGEGSGTVTLRSGRRDLASSEVARLLAGETLAAGGFVFLEVEDTGSGMDTETQARIFDPFFTTKFTGRGLGLAAMQGIVRGHGGGVEIRSSPGAGTLFRVYLPVAAGAEVRAEEPPQAPAAAEAWRGQGVVLVADDEPGIRHFVQKLLDRAGFAVLLASDGVEAVELFRSHRAEIRLVLLDLTMPRMGGDEALAAIRTLSPGVPVIRWSGYAATDRVAEADGVYLAKPFQAADLLEKIREILGG